MTYGIYGKCCKKIIEISNWAFRNYTALLFAILANFILTAQYFYIYGVDILFIIFLCIFFSLLFIQFYLKKEKTREGLKRCLMRYNFDKPRIAILVSLVSDVNGINLNYIPKNVIFSVQNWIDTLSQFGINPELITYRNDFSKYSLIINPYCPYYVEENFSNLKTFQKIKNYIYWGGVFVNVGDLPFWKAWDQESNRFFHTSTGVTSFLFVTDPSAIRQIFNKKTVNKLTPIIEEGSLIDTLLYREFGVRVSLGNPQPMTIVPAREYLNDIGSINLTEFRSTVNCEVEGNILYNLYINSTNSIFPVSALNNFIGYLITFGIHLQKQTELNFECKIINNIIKRLASKGNL